LVQAIKLFNQAQLDLRASDQSQLALELAFVEAALGELPPESEPQAKVEAEQRPQFAPAKDRAKESPALSEVAESEAIADTPATATVPAAPPRVRAASPTQTDPALSEASDEGDQDVVEIALDELEQNWTAIKHAIRSQSRQVEALVNSSTVLGIEQKNRLILEFASEFLSSKLEKEENRRIVEQSISQVLDKKCRVRATYRGADPSNAVPDERPETEPPANVPENGLPPETDLYRETEGDPVIQDLVNRGGQVTDVQVLSDE
jgi:hypothetical protein